MRLTVLTIGLLAAPSAAQAGVCDVQDVDATGCAAGECCYFDETETPICVAGGAGTQGGTCAASNDCACGHVCLAQATGPECAQWCGLGTPDDGACPAGSLCTVSLLGQEGTVLGFACETPDLCDPIGQDCEAPGEACYVIAPDGTTSCAPAGDRGPGSAVQLPERLRRRVRMRRGRVLRVLRSVHRARRLRARRPVHRHRLDDPGDRGPDRSLRRVRGRLGRRRGRGRRRRRGRGRRLRLQDDGISVAGRVVPLRDYRARNSRETELMQ